MMSQMMMGNNTYQNNNNFSPNSPNLLTVDNELQQQYGMTSRVFGNSSNDNKSGNFTDTLRGFNTNNNNLNNQHINNLYTNSNSSGGFGHSVNYY